MTTTPAQNRQPSGTPVGGQYAATARAAADASVTLAPAQDSPEAQVAAFQSALRAISGADARPDHLPDSCGGPTTSLKVLLLNVEAWNAHIGVTIEHNSRTPGGSARLYAEWEEKPLREQHERRQDGTQRHVRFDELDETEARALVDQMVTQVHMQLQADKQVNRPQSELNTKYGSPYANLLHYTAEVDEDGPAVTVTDYRSSRGAGRPVTFRLDDAGRIVGGSISTDYGAVALEGESLRTVAKEVERTTQIALEQYEVSLHTTFEQLEERLARIAVGD